MLRVYLLVVAISFSALSSASEEDDRAAFKEHYGLYQALSEEEDWSAAVPHAKKAYELGLSLLGEEHKSTAALQYNWGYAMLALSRDEQAVPVLLEALKKFEALYGKNSEQLIPILMDLSRARASQLEDVRQEKAGYHRALRIAEEIHGKNSVYYGRLAGEAGNTLMSKSRSRSAKGFLTQSYESFSSTLGENHPQTGVAAYNLGRYELATRDSRDAIKYFTAALASFERPDEPANDLEMRAHAFLVQAYESDGDSESATKHCLAIGKMTPATPTQDYMPLYRKAPMYPSNAQRAGLEGYVIVEYSVDDFGFVVNPKVESSHGPKSFHRVALDAVSKFRYAPQFENGKPVVTDSVKNKFTFSLVK